MNANYQEILITIIAGAIGVAIAFYIKEFLQRKHQYRRLRNKLEKIAGKNARIIYEGDEIFKIAEIDENGVTLTSELKTLFIPTAKLLQTEIVLPSDEYDEIIERRKKEKEEEKNKIMVEALQRTMPSLADTFLKEYEKESQQIRDLLKQVIEKASIGSEGDVLERLISILINLGALQPPDPAQVLGMKLARILTDEGIVPALDTGLPEALEDKPSK
jgi:hypothetical protein